MTLKILLLSHRFYPDIGGIESNSEVLANAFHRAGSLVHVLTWTSEIGEKTFPYAIIRNPNRRTVIGEHKWADVVFENNPCLRLSWAGIFVRRPLVVAINTWISRTSGKKALPDLLKMIWLKKAKSVIAVSHAVKNHTWPSAVVIQNPYNSKLFRRIPTVPKTINFVFLGRLVSDKGADQAILAVARLLEEGIIDDSEIQLTIIGNGPEEENLKKQVLHLNLSKLVMFMGNLAGEELVRCLNQHRYMLVPSVWKEPFGIVALEGMACGCVPIVSDGGGLPEAVGDGGLVFKRNNTNSLVQTIKNIISNPQLEAHLREAASPHLAAHSLDFIAGKYLKVLQGEVFE